MMVRSALHAVSTIAGFSAMQMMHEAPIWIRMTLYAASWVACALAYVPILFLGDQIVDAWDERMRRIVRDELDRRELVAYKRDVERLNTRQNGSRENDEKLR